MLTVKDTHVYVGPDLVGVFSSPEAAQAAAVRFYTPRNVLADSTEFKAMLRAIANLPPGPRAHREVP